MKLRILDNSIRLRLTRTEVGEAAAKGIVNGILRFADGAAFRYTLESSPAIVDSSASFQHGELSVRMPQSEVRSWADSNEVSMLAEQLLENGQKLAILVEKDFACLAPRDGEDDSDMFPHPEADNKTC